ncbi:MAG: DUF2723 domain-containing protein [Bacteroidales bacterium]|nr:DUF2723 domain-containing protein [Bacteroidales bacterium]
MSNLPFTLRKLDLITGWVVFAIATVVYFMTVEPTASWWDCGEFIATAYKLQVTHPPGAPLFQMIGRVFTLFAGGDTANIALMVNIMSALSSSFSILFLFWSITMLAEKSVKATGELTEAKVYIILGAGIVGALAYTFSDSFWFSAVEGEVYAMSSFFTAIVFWAILRWERVADEKRHLHWMLLIAYLIGLSIGVHLLNLLAIPAIAYIYYFKKYEVTPKGIIITGLIAVVTLFFIMNLLIPGVVQLEAKSELLFVNTFGLPFNSGTIVFLSLLTGLIVWALAYTQRYKKVVLNTIVLALTFILIGYSSFFMIVIRANADPPQNMNSPSDAMAMLSYLGREQYGTWPLLHGQYYNAPYDPAEPASDGTPVYRKDTTARKYVIVDDRKGVIPNYDPRFETIFPRMWSNSRQAHIDAYKHWGKVKGVPISTTQSDGTREVLYKPTFGENLRFFFSYQISHMYFRYFMWNFVGRQNDVEGHGNITDGNWLSGISFIDNWRLGNQQDLPPGMQNPANNKFYFLPLLLGLIGLLYHWKRNYKDTVVVALLFLMTGLAIVVYLNQTPYQPRERDYSYAGSFYAFAIWIGFGVISLWEILSKVLKNAKVSAVIASIVALLLVPGIMAIEGWDDHNRSNRYVARDFAHNYLVACDPDAVLITYGDNDTFPLWYIQDVEDVRTDVRVANHMLASGDWYVHQLARAVNDSPPLPFTISNEQYGRGSNDAVYFWDRGLQGHRELKELINFVASDADHTKVTLGGRRMSYFPTKKIKITIDRDAVLANGIVPAHMADHIEPELSWEVKPNAIYRNDLMLLDFLATSNWTRPLYFTSPSGILEALNLEEYIHLEGFVYKLMPVKADHYVRGLGGINVEATYDALMNKAKWGNINDPRVTVDRESMRNSMFPRQNFMRLAQALLDENRIDSAVAVADRFVEIFPNDKFPFDRFTTPFTEVYYEAGMFEKGNELVRTIANNYMADIDYYDNQRPAVAAYFGEDREIAMIMLQRLSMSARVYDQPEVAEEIDSFITIRGQ